MRPSARRTPIEPTNAPSCGLGGAPKQNRTFVSASEAVLTPYGLRPPSRKFSSNFNGLDKQIGSSHLWRYRTSTSHKLPGTRTSDKLQATGTATQAPSGISTATGTEHRLTTGNPHNLK
jgi:hypothetical protein